MHHLPFKNYMEDAVNHMLNRLAPQYPHICMCERCRPDMMMIALNNLPPRYVSTHKADVLRRVESMEMSYDVEVLTETTDSRIITATRKGSDLIIGIGTPADKNLSSGCFFGRIRTTAKKICASASKRVRTHFFCGLFVTGRGCCYVREDSPRYSRYL